MHPLLYIVFTPIRYTLSTILWAVVAICLLINWVLCGDSGDHVQGLIGFLFGRPPGWLDTLNKRMICWHNDLKPQAWTFKESISEYRRCIRAHVLRGANNYEHANRIRRSLDHWSKAWDGKKTFRFWTAVVTRMNAKMEKMRLEQIAEDIEQNRKLMKVVEL